MVDHHEIKTRNEQIGADWWQQLVRLLYLYRHPKEQTQRVLL
jgi:hypothetical protein